MKSLLNLKQKTIKKKPKILKISKNFNPKKRLGKSYITVCFNCHDMM